VGLELLTCEKWFTDARLIVRFQSIQGGLIAGVALLEMCGHSPSCRRAETLGAGANSAHLFHPRWFYSEPRSFVTVGGVFVRAAMPNLTTLFQAGGFVGDFNKKTWSKPDLNRFDDPDEVWDHYKFRGTPEQRARLRTMLDAIRERQAGPKCRCA
jgi:hypothetical protein